MRCLDGGILHNVRDLQMGKAKQQVTARWPLHVQHEGVAVFAGH